eukprot:238745_1
MELKHKENENRVSIYLKAFIELNKNVICEGVQGKQINCVSVDRLAFMLGKLQENEMNLLGCVLKEYNETNQYDIKEFYADIDHIDVHLQTIPQLKKYMKKHYKEIKDCKVNLACWLLRRYTRSDKDHFAKQMIEMNDSIDKNIHLNVIVKELDILHCRIFHMEQINEQRDFRTMYVNYNQNISRSPDEL